MRSRVARTAPWLLTPFLLAAQCQVEPRSDGPRPCELACANLERLGCEEAEPTPAGAPCTTWMCHAEAGPVSHNPTCIAGAPTCEAARECGE